MFMKYSMVKEIDKTVEEINKIELPFTVVVHTADEIV